ncbi:hypothetical protein K9M47_04780 [Candidatus Gracilibacteria bacterium]|nr:hypothetical protein [Candidatus Gracilibacteria bacterium]MCF7898777.1 hypothetical protein [Candidatus Paceibacterota bacterium]
MKLSQKQIEEIENKYLTKFYFFLKYTEDELLKGFNTKEKIKDDWMDKYKSGISDFAVGAERIVYSLFNGKGIGQPNSAPVGSDMFFEVDDAFIHIDLKTVQTENIGDYTSSIFVGSNQNSYKSEIKQLNGSSFSPVRIYEPALPTYYNKDKENEKICLSYFITILYERENLSILNINILSMPNGELESHYKNRPLQAGKIAAEARFNLYEVSKFELLDTNPSRIKVAYFKNDMKKEFKDRLSFFNNLLI